jgi:DNA-binding CsgD family transcriptional regulator
MPSRHAEPAGGRDMQRPDLDLLLRHLSVRQRQIIVGTYFRGRTTREAARHLGLSPDTAKTELYHAMRALADMLATGRPDPAGHRPPPVPDRAGHRPPPVPDRAGHRPPPVRLRRLPVAK